MLIKQRWNLFPLIALCVCCRGRDHAHGWIYSSRYSCFGLALLEKSLWSICPCEKAVKSGIHLIVSLLALRSVYHRIHQYRGHLRARNLSGGAPILDFNQLILLKHVWREHGLLFDGLQLHRALRKAFLVSVVETLIKVVAAVTHVTSCILFTRILFDVLPILRLVSNHRVAHWLGLIVYSCVSLLLSYRLASSWGEKLLAGENSHLLLGFFVHREELLSLSGRHVLCFLVFTHFSHDISFVFWDWAEILK